MEQSSKAPQRSGTVRSIAQKATAFQVRAKNAAAAAATVAGLRRRNTISEMYEKAVVRGEELERKRWVEILFEYAVYLLLLSFIYFVLVGLPLWKGAVYWMYWVISTKFVIAGGFSIIIGVAAFYCYGPLFVLFEKEPPTRDNPPDFDRLDIPGVSTTALLIPCYKSAGLIAATLEAALKIFPPSHIYVLANGNSEVPLDNTEEVCRPYGVNHIWSPVGSKIVAQFVGCHAAKEFEHVLLIDDDCALPPNFPIRSNNLRGRVQCIGYTIKSVGPNSSKGNWCQQAQDLEYKLSGIQRCLAGVMGSATFPHGAISLWNREFLIKTFNDHPGFSVSEDWFFGHSCRRLGGRITMCSAVFVETETPAAVFWSGGGAARGGFGEMTVFKQRFKRWNFFFVNGMWYNMAYIFGSWKLGWWEIGAKIFVFQEVYETLLYLFTPFILPLSFIVQPAFCGYLLAGTVVMYFLNVLIFNEVHLRLRKERISWTVLLVYYMPYKLILTLVNVASCYWSLWKYAKYFAKRHPKVIEDAKAVEVVVRLDEYSPHNTPRPTRPPSASSSHVTAAPAPEPGPSGVVRSRSMRVTAVGRNPSLNHGPGRVQFLPRLEAETMSTHAVYEDSIGDGTTMNEKSRPNSFDCARTLEEARGDVGMAGTSPPRHIRLQHQNHPNHHHQRQQGRHQHANLRPQQQKQQLDPRRPPQAHLHRPRNFTAPVEHGSGQGSRATTPRTSRSSSRERIPGGQTRGRASTLPEMDPNGRAGMHSAAGRHPQEQLQQQQQQHQRQRSESGSRQGEEEQQQAVGIRGKRVHEW